MLLVITVLDALEQVVVLTMYIKLKNWTTHYPCPVFDGSN